MMRNVFSILCLSFLTFSNVSGTFEERKLRQYLFDTGNYNKNIRPVRNYSHPVKVEQGIAVQTLESFDQINEAISLNLWIRSSWNDEYLRWDNSPDPDLQELDFLSVDKDEIWIPDTELLNAATKPDIYYLQGGINLYPDGSILYSKPGIFTSSCSLDLRDFPFDSQNCTILTGSWVYHDELLQLMPYADENKQVDVMGTFSHSEWQVDHVEVRHLKEKRDCCPDKEFDQLSYSFILNRFTHYYRISMGMTITLVLVSFVIMLMSPSNVSRTSTAVFIPLTILALQLTIANKIPVVGYYTLMDKFFLCCFITSMICSIESGLIYAIITTKSPRFYDLLDRIFKFDFNNKKTDEVEEDNLRELENQGASPDSVDSNQNSLEEFKMVEKALEEVARDDNIRLRVNIDNPNISKDAEIGSIHSRELDDVSLKDDFLISNDIKKVIDYDDKRLYLTPRQQKIDSLVNSYLSRIDTVVRVILPIVFFSYIIYIFSLDNGA